MSIKALDDPSYPLHKSDAQWREQLDPMQYQVARHAATERAFSGKYWDHFEAGRYDCIGCGTPLFASHTKFDAGCGWPSSCSKVPKNSLCWSIRSVFGDTDASCPSFSQWRTWRKFQPSG